MANFFKKMTPNERGHTEEINEIEKENIELSNQDFDPASTFSREQAKADLERRIAEKLSRMSNTDLEELFNAHQQQLLAKKKAERTSVSRRNPAVIEGQISFGDVKKEEEIFESTLGPAQFLEPEPANPEPLPEPVVLPEPVISLEPVVLFEPAVLREPEPLFEPAPPAILPEEPAKISDAELEARVDDFYKGFSQEEQEALSEMDFAKTFSIYFDKFASGAMLEAGHEKVKKASGKVSAALSVMAAKIAIVAMVIFAAVKKVFKKLASISAIFPKKAKREKTKTSAIKRVFLKYKRRLVKKEKKASLRMASFINKWDKSNDQFAEKTVEVAVNSNRRFNFAREWADLNKKKLIAGLVVLISCAITAVSVTNYFTAYVYAYNGKALGMVKNQEDVLRVLEIVSEQLTREHGTEIEIDKDKDITFELVRSVSINKEIDDMQEVFNRLTYMQDMNAKAYALYIDNKRIAILDTEESVQKLLDAFRDSYLYQSEETTTEYKEISFAERIDIEQIDTQLGRLDDADEIMEKMKTGAVAQKIHVVQKGETLSGIAKYHGISQAELEASNPGIIPAKLKIEQEIILVQAVPLLTVQTVEIATYSAAIPYETIYEDNPNVFKGEQTTKIKGVDGEREVTAKIIRNNGFEVGREETDSKIIREASSAVVSRGTKDPPPLQGTGKLRNPLSSGYKLSSKFGMRGGRMHYGIDMACKTGTRIGAADGGTVTFAGYKGSLGYLVIINHGGNRETYYAHCSALFVKSGAKVYQGQHIANVGSTGRSTGSHLHFEVHERGVARNPLNYI